MTDNEQSFIDAAIEWDCATHRYNVAAQAASRGFTRGHLMGVDDYVALCKARENVARVMNSASIEFDKAKKRVTDPFVHLE